LKTARYAAAHRLWKDKRKQRGGGGSDKRASIYTLGFRAQLIDKRRVVY